MNEQVSYYKSKLHFEIDSSDLFASLENGERIIIIDTRKREAYDKEHIPSSINIPHKEMTKESTKDLDKNMLYVCYCDGIGCNASTKGALNLTSLGFKVKELIGGIVWWKQDGYATEGIEPQPGSKFVCAC